MLPIAHLDDSISVLNLPKRVYNALRRYGVRTISDLLARMDRGDLQLIPNIGALGMSQINETLSTYKILTDKRPSEKTLTLDEQFNSPWVVSNHEDIFDTPQFKEIVLWERAQVEKQIHFQTLHRDAILRHIRIEDWLSYSSIEQSHYAYIAILSSLNIVQELKNITRELSQRAIKILAARHGISRRKLENIGDELGISRERVRQISQNAQDKTGSLLKSLTTVRLQSALLFARDMDFEITYKRWRENITLSGLLGIYDATTFAGEDPIELLVACGRLSEINDSNSTLKMPENFYDAISLASVGRANVAARVVHIDKNLSKEIRKTIKRNILFTGVVSAKWLAQEAKIDTLDMQEILLAMDFSTIADDWLIPQNIHVIQATRRDVFHNAIQKMSNYCGPLIAEQICSGLRQATSRNYSFPIPPPEVMSLVLEYYGYSRKGDSFFWDGKYENPLSQSESIILESLKIGGYVAHHAELAQIFIDSDLSFPSLHGTLRRSPLFEKMRKGLYRLRGQQVKQEAIIRAKNAAERIPVEVEVNYRRTGEIEISANLGILAIAVGEILSSQLPNLTGEGWKCFANNKEFRPLIVTDNVIKRLSKPLEYLGCKVGDRVKMVFAPFTRTVNISKV